MFTFIIAPTCPNLMEMTDQDWQIPEAGTPLPDDPDAHARAHGTHITFKGTFHKLQTLADGGLRVSFDLPLSELMEATKLPGLSNHVLQVACIPVPVKRDERGPW